MLHSRHGEAAFPPCFALSQEATATKPDMRLIRLSPMLTAPGLSVARIHSIYITGLGCCIRRSPLVGSTNPSFSAAASVHGAYV